MATVTKRIGLSLGADICWPICFEDSLGGTIQVSGTGSPRCIIAA